MEEELRPRGLVIGRFLPPHAGHLHLIDAARAAAGTVVVVVGARDADRIPAATRAAWLRELRPDVDVVVTADHLPDDPADPGYWETWVADLRRVLPQVPGLLFSSEDYGEILAPRLGARHVLVDAERRAVPISATAVWRDPLAAWPYLPAPVRGHFAVRVAIVGAESTGKTTLAAELARRFGTAWVPEFARGYLDAAARHCVYADMEPIARGQAASEDAAARRCDRLLFCDTDTLTTTLWSDCYYSRCPEWITADAARRRYPLTLLLAGDLPWVDDAQRDNPHMAAWFEERFRAELDRLGRRWRLVSGSGAERVRRAVDIVAEETGVSPATA